METKTDLPQIEVDTVFAWRMTAFLEMGYDADESEILAISDVDLHQARALLMAGCSRELAAKILI